MGSSQLSVVVVIRVLAIGNEPGPFAAGAVAGCGEEDPEPVVVEVSESVGESADLLDDQVDDFGAAVGDAAVSK
jgi:hypothetical protein